MNTLDISNPNNYSYETKHLEIHILGGLKTNKLESLRVTLAINKIKNTTTLRHPIDLYNDNHVEKFTRTIAERLEIGTSIARRTLQDLTKELENYRFLLLDKQVEATKPYSKTLTASEEKAAITFLKSKDLLDKTNIFIGASGVIGEDVNRLLMYILFTSRKTNNPLHCISLGSSGVGKTHLQSTIAALMPEEDVIEVTNLSANALYYFARTELSHKIIIIEDMDGAQAVLYPLREIASKKKITKTVVHKDKNGNSKTIRLTVEGPVCIAGATTQESIYEDNANRSFLLYIDESGEQDKKIMNYQRLISAGKVNEQEQLRAAAILKNVQRVLKPIKVINPYAEYLELPQSVFKPRRTNSHYMQFIEAITFYKQYQREVKTKDRHGEPVEPYIETTIEDIKEANELMQEVLLRKSDTINGATRNYLETLKTYLKNRHPEPVEGQTTFTNAEIRRNLRIKESTLRNYHKQLLAEDYIKRVKKVNPDGYRDKSYCFEIIDIDEYTKLKEQINNALQEAIDKIKGKE